MNQVSAIPRHGPIRVLQLVDRLNVGGPAALATLVNDRVDPGRFECQLLAGTTDATEGEYVGIRESVTPVERIPGLGRSPHAWRDVQAMSHITRALRAFRPHVVHTHKAKAGVLGRLAAWGVRVPATVHTFHGHLLYGYFPTRTTRAVVATERALARHTTTLVAVGQRVRDELIDAGIGRREQYAVVAPGVELPSLPAPPEARRALGLPADAPVVGYVGRLTAVKRPERFVDVAAALAGAHPDAWFVVAGDGDLLDELRRRATQLCGPRVVFVGWRGDVETVYAACDVVALTSDNEGMPVSLVEAGMAGVPAVTTAVGSAAEVVVDGTTGLVTSTRVEDLARATGILLRDPGLRTRMGRAAEARAREVFGADRLVRDMEALYERAARREENS